MVWLCEGSNSVWCGCVRGETVCSVVVCGVKQCVAYVHVLIVSILTWLLCTNATNTLHNKLYNLFTFDIERVVPVKFSSANYTVGENRRFFTGALETPGHHARTFTVYVVTRDTNATATGQHHAVVYRQTC